MECRDKNWTQNSSLNFFEISQCEWRRQEQSCPVQLKTLEEIKVKGIILFEEMTKNACLVYPCYTKPAFVTRT